jgi:hypothetical protein
MGMLRVNGINLPFESCNQIFEDGVPTFKDFGCCSNDGDALWIEKWMHIRGVNNKTFQLQRFTGCHYYMV